MKKKPYLILITTLLYFVITGCNGTNGKQAIADNEKTEIIKEDTSHAHKEESAEVDHDKHENKDEHEEHEKEQDGHEDETSKTEEHSDEEEIDVVIDEKTSQMIGLTTASPVVRELFKKIKLSGEIVPNGDSLQYIHPRFTGLVTKVNAGPGDFVKQGETLAEIQNNETMSTYTVKSLLAGTIIERDVTVGQIVSEETKIFSVADLKSVWVEFDLHLKDKPFVNKGQDIFIHGVGTAMQTKGSVSQISPTLSHEKRSFSVRVVLENINNVWSPGMFVRGTLNTPVQNSSLTVPNEAIQSYNERDIVFVLEEENVFTLTYVTLGTKDDEHTAILSGLSSEDKVVTKGAFDLKSKLVTSSLGGHAGHGH